MPQLPPWLWAVLTAAIIVGLIAGERLNQIVHPRTARRLMVVQAYTGSTAAAIRGISQILG